MAERASDKGQATCRVMQECPETAGLTMSDSQPLATSVSLPRRPIEFPHRVQLAIAEKGIPTHPRLECLLYRYLIEASVDV